jgi:biopolymer transport protein TolR
MSHKRHLDAELNLVPFIDLLSVCICFLLLTAVWIQVGSMNVKQAVGGQAAADTVKKPVMWVFLGDKGDLTLDVRDSKSASGKMRITGVDGKPDYSNLEKTVAALKVKEPQLATALIQPGAQSIYEDIIDIMDNFKKSGIIDLGVAPL